MDNTSKRHVKESRDDQPDLPKLGRPRKSAPTRKTVQRIRKYNQRVKENRDRDLEQNRFQNNNINTGLEKFTPDEDMNVNKFVDTTANTSNNSEVEDFSKRIKVEDEDIELESLHHFVDIKEETSMDDFKVDEDYEHQMQLGVHAETHSAYSATLKTPSAPAAAFIPRTRNEEKTDSNGTAEIDLQILETLKSMNQEKKEDISFGNLVIVELSKIDNPAKKRKVKKQILDLLFSDDVD